MSSAQEAANALPSNINTSALQGAFSNPMQLMSMLDKNGDGKITKEDLELLLKQFGINGTAAKVLAKYLFKQIDANKNGIIEPSDLVQASGLLLNLFELKQERSDF
ncbi:unnamed protein product [Didymodactylos carnosus]|uniref:EF-hand domain-containing protein n=1 Tax=Didymodactylos carnosus TaxID=1234261 RepID=A0A8S2DR89_9BILA|nr:unnamed protein product [Didymodactylos carnosus]CAF3799258.1 unnamed protein product [Didymodactylos carnosus]